MTDPDDSDNLMRWVKIMNKSHGYGGIFNHGSAEDKAIVELATAEEWRKSIAAEYGIVVGYPELNPDDPPDCFVQGAGRRLGLELVQLIDQEHKSRATGEESPFAGQLFSDMQWSEERLGLALNAVIQKKGAKYESCNLLVDVLLIHTAEPWLSSSKAEEWLKTLKIRRHASIGSASLLFEYEPGRGSEHWPVFWLYGNLTTSKNGA